MVAGCANNMVKSIFFGFNFLVFFLGAIICSVSLWIRFDDDFQSRISNTIKEGNSASVEMDQMYLALYGSAIIGGMLCLTGFLGCCGACCESTCLLGLFFTINMLLFAVELSGCIYIYVKKDAIEDQVAKVYKTQLVDRYDEHPSVQKQLDHIQAHYNCCGATGCQDYQNRTGGAPASCGCDESPKQGCSNQAFELLASHITIVGGFAVVILGVELLAMIFSCILCSAIRDNGYDAYKDYS